MIVTIQVDVIVPEDSDPETIGMETVEEITEILQDADISATLNLKEVWEHLP